MTFNYNLSPIIARNFKTILFGLAIFSLLTYVYLIFIAVQFWEPLDFLKILKTNNLSFELSHVPLHFFAIFLTTVAITWLYETLEKSIKKFSQNQSRIFHYFPLAEKSFKVIGISLKDIHENRKEFEEMMRKLTTENCPTLDMKFLLLYPESDFVKNREIEEDGNVSGRIKEECEKTIDALNAVKGLLKITQKHHFNFYTYKMIPRHSVIIVDDNLVNVVPYLYKKKGFKTEGFESSDPQTVQQYVEEFNLIWSEMENNPPKTPEI